MENWGLSLETSYKLNLKDFTFNIGANASYLKNKLIKLGNASGEAIYENAGATKNFQITKLLIPNSNY